MVKSTVPSSMGIPIIAQTIAVQKSDGTFISDIVSCDGSNSGIVLAPNFTIPIAVLKTNSFNLQPEASIYATLIATDVLGSSSAWERSSYPSFQHSLKSSTLWEAKIVLDFSRKESSISKIDKFFGHWDLCTLDEHPNIKLE